jgi:hypothetical protein
MSLETDTFELKRMMRQEAHEKSFEIQVMGQRLFEAEKNNLVRSGVVLVQEDFEKKLANLNINLNIERSSRTNKTRIDRMHERHNCVEEIRKITHEQIKKSLCATQSNDYK